MPFSKGFTDDYIQVNERILKFIEKFPEGSLQSEIVELTGDRVVMRGVAYRHPDDPKPGVGHSFLEIPGKTPFTRGSEIENAETSAWGRALAALGFEVKRGIASYEEVRNKTGEEDETPEISGSEIPGVERGGRTTKANAIQVRQARMLSNQLDLGVRGFRDAITEILDEKLELPDEEDAGAKVLTEYLKDLPREEIQKLIQGLTAKVEAADGPREVNPLGADQELGGSV